MDSVWGSDFKSVKLGCLASTANGVARCAQMVSPPVTEEIVFSLARMPNSTSHGTPVVRLEYYPPNVLRFEQPKYHGM